MSKVVHVVGARPQFIKVAPVLKAFRGKCSCYLFLAHAGEKCPSHPHRLGRRVKGGFFLSGTLPYPAGRDGMGGNP